MCKETHLRKLKTVTFCHVCNLVQEQDLKQLYLAVEQCIFLLHFFFFRVVLVLLQSHSVFILNYILKNETVNAS